MDEVQTDLSDCLRYLGRSGVQAPAHLVISQKYAMSVLLSPDGSANC